MPIQAACGANATMLAGVSAVHLESLALSVVQWIAYTDHACDSQLMSSAAYSKPMAHVEGCSAVSSSMPSQQQIRDV